jgi:hypothetical protein
VAFLAARGATVESSWLIVVAFFFLDLVFLYFAPDFLDLLSGEA